MNKTKLIKETERLAVKYSWIPPQLQTIVELIPTIVLSVCNAVLLNTAKIVSKLEKWDY